MNASNNEEEMSSQSAEASRPQKKQPPSKAQRSKKPKREGLPKRPMSAYNVFFKEERLRWLNEDEKDQGNGEANVGGKSKFLQMSDAIASKWKALKDRSKYEEVAREDNKRYRKAMEEYNENIIRSTRIGRAALDGALHGRMDNTVVSETPQMSLQQAFDTPLDLQNAVRPTGPPGPSGLQHLQLPNMGIASNNVSLQQLQNEALLRQFQEQQSNSVMLMNLRQQQNAISQLQLDQQLRYQQNQMQLQALVSRLQGPQSVNQMAQQFTTDELLLSLLRKK